MYMYMYIYISLLPHTRSIGLLVLVSQKRVGPRNLGAILRHVKYAHIYIYRDMLYMYMSWM